MGAQQFKTTGYGKTAVEAFTAAVAQAQWDHGHSGYSGSIAEKTDFEMVEVPAGVDPRRYANSLFNNFDHWMHDKWGPAGCVALGEGKWLFFGYASS